MPGEKISTSIRVDAALWERLKEMAELDRRSTSRAVEEAIELYIKKVGRERGKERAA